MGINQRTNRGNIYTVTRIGGVKGGITRGRMPELLCTVGVVLQYKVQHTIVHNMDAGVKDLVP